MTDLPIACTLTSDDMTARVALIDALVAAESQCCAFLDFTLGRDDGDLVLDIAGPEDARPVIEMLFAPAA